MNCSALFSAVLCMHLRAAMLPFSKGFKQFHSSSGSGVSGQKVGKEYGCVRLVVFVTMDSHVQYVDEE